MFQKKRIFPTKRHNKRRRFQTGCAFGEKNNGKIVSMSFENFINRMDIAWFR